MLMRSFLYLVAFGVTKFFCWQYFQPQPELSWEQQIQAIANSGHSSAEQLASLAKSHPALLTKTLRGRHLAVSGLLQKALVRGVAADELSLDLAGLPDKKIFFASTHPRLANRGNYKPAHKFEKIGVTIFMITKNKKEPSASGESQNNFAQSVIGKIASISGSTSKQRNPPAEPVVEKTFLFREGSSATLEGTFKYVNASSVMFDWHPPEI